MSYREGRDRSRRSRSRSKSPERARDRSRSRDRLGRNDGYRLDARDRRDHDSHRDSDRIRENDRSKEYDRKERERSRDRPRDREAVDKNASASTAPKEKPKSAKALEEAERMERLALVKRLTHGDDAETEEKKVGLNEDDENYDAEEDMMELLGFKGFDSTKGKAVDDNLKGPGHGAVAKNKKRIYRQYMNRKGGFNRPLQKIA